MARGNTPKQILPSSISANLVKDRGETYGHPAKNFQRIAELWSTVLSDKLAQPLTPQDVALCMLEVKISRLVESPFHTDSIVDVCGFADCLHMVNDHPPVQLIVPRD